MALRPNDKNPRSISPERLELLTRSVKRFGDISGIVKNVRSGNLVTGHQRVATDPQAEPVIENKEAAEAGTVATGYIVINGQRFAYREVDWDPETEAAAMVAANNHAGEWDEPRLAELMRELKTGGFDMELTGLSFDTIDALLAPATPGAQQAEARATLAERFGVPPFTVLDARQGYWQDRKRAWLNLGIQSEIGRGSTPGTSARAKPGEEPTYREIGSKASTLGAIDSNESAINGRTGPYASRANAVPSGAPMPLDRAAESSGTSIFDPVLCELAYRWFCPPGGRIIDTFAGGSVRGIVASVLGYDYTGIDLSDRQVTANHEQAARITPEKQPRWIVSDSTRLDTIVAGEEFDFYFSCPPYADLEVYSEAVDDLSVIAARSYGEFIALYWKIIALACARLKPNRFAAFVVGDLRCPDGFYRNFVGDTVTGFLKAGMQLYNEAILVTAVGSLPIRIGRQFGAYRKLGKTHQNVLVFFKGDPKTVKEWPEIQFGNLLEPGEPEA